MDADTGDVAADTVVADVTVTIGMPKNGLTEPAALEGVQEREMKRLGSGHPSPAIDRLTPDLTGVPDTSFLCWHNRDQDQKIRLGYRWPWSPHP